MPGCNRDIGHYQPFPNSYVLIVYGHLLIWYIFRVCNGVIKLSQDQFYLESCLMRLVYANNQLVFHISRPVSLLIDMVFFSSVQSPLNLLKISIGHYLGL
jgi:hypothetical protein